MSIIRSLRSAGVAYIKAKVSGFRDVKPHIGRYTVEDLKRMHSAAPACAIGVVNASKPVQRPSGEVQIDVALAAVIVTRAARVEDADDEAMDLALAVAASVAAWVPAQTVRRVQPATDIHMEGVADDEIDKAGLVVWAVLWRHSATFGADDIAAGIGSVVVPEGIAPTVTQGAPA